MSEILDALQLAALQATREQADALVREAGARAEQTLEQARREADAVRARIAAAAQAQAQAHALASVSAAHAEAHGLVLAAQRSVLEQARTAAREAAGALLTDKRYAALLERLAAQARMRLADDGEVSVVAAPQGGLVALTTSRRLDYSLDACVDRALDAMASELESLWKP